MSLYDQDDPYETEYQEWCDKYKYDTTTRTYPSDPLLLEHFKRWEAQMNNRWGDDPDDYR